MVDKLTEVFCERHGIIPTSEEENIIHLAILEGMSYQMEKDIEYLKTKINKGN